MSARVPARRATGLAAGVRVLLLAALGALWTIAGLALTGSSWIDPAGITAAGVALMALALNIRSWLDLLVVLAPFMFRVLSPVGLLNLGTSDLLLPLVLVVLVVRTVVERPPGRQPRSLVPGAVPIAVAAAVLLVGSLTTWSVVDPDFLVNKAVSDTAKLLIGMVYLGVAIALVRRSGPDATHRAIVLWTWVATAVAAASVVGAVADLDLVPDDGYRSLGFFADPNLYAGYLLLSLALLLVRATTPGPGLRAPVLAGQAVVVVGGLVTTGSRGGLATLALLMLFAFLVVRSAKVRIALVTLVAGALVVALVLLPDDETRSTAVLGVDRLLVSSAESGDDSRLELWRLAVDLWLTHPLFGIGMGQYPRFSVGIVGELHTSDLGHVVHNSFLSVLVSLGVVGLVVFLGLFGWLLRSVYSSTSLTRNQQHALVAGMLVIAAQMMTLNLENLRYVWLHFGLAVGLAVTTRRSDELGGTYHLFPTSNQRHTEPVGGALTRQGGA